MPSLDVPTKGNNTPTPSLQEQLAALELEEKLRLKAERDEMQSRRARQLAQKKRDLEAEEATKKANQAACPHLQPDNSTAYGGQWCSDGKLHLVCGRCEKNAIYEELSPVEKGYVNQVLSRFGGSLQRMGA